MINSKMPKCFFTTILNVIKRAANLVSLIFIIIFIYYVNITTERPMMDMADYYCLLQSWVNCNSIQALNTEK